MTETWVGFDLDGTLAVWKHGDSIEQIGSPIVKMVQVLLGFQAAGIRCKIFTARVGPCEMPAFARTQRDLISAWCHKHIGNVLEITNEKDFKMVLLFDDRAIAVQPNTGKLSARPSNCDFLLRSFDPWEKP